MKGPATSKRDGHPWWPSLLLAPTFAAIAIAAWGQGESATYIRRNPCITGWEVPWTLPFTALHSLGILAAIAAVAVAFAARGRRTRVVALACLVVGISLWGYAGALMSIPYGWNCDVP